MKLSIIVLMTSWAPKRALRTPGTAPHADPASIATSSVIGSSTNADRCPSAAAARAAANAATVSCPSTPMLNSPARKPTATARPQKTSGVALNSVWPIP